MNSRLDWNVNLAACFFLFYMFLHCRRGWHHFAKNVPRFNVFTKEMLLFWFSIQCSLFEEANSLGKSGTAELGGVGPPPHFLPQTQFLTAFLGHRINKSCKVTRTVTKIWWPNRRKSHFQSFSFQNFPGPIRSDPSRWIARSALEDGSPHSKLRSAVPGNAVKTVQEICC